jgi:hypothetical protein
MSLWRIRITISDDPRSLELFTEVLADQPTSLVRLAPRDAGACAGTSAADMTGEVVVELGQDEGLATLLGALHGISPQVFISRAEPDERGADSGFGRAVPGRRR